MYEKAIIVILILCIVGLLVLLFRREHIIDEQRRSLDELGTELREQRTRAKLAERSIAAVRYRVTECINSVSGIAARNGTALEIVRELKKRFTEMENVLASNTNNVDSRDSSNTSTTEITS